MLNKVDILGAGPAGLYTAILLRRHFPTAQVRVTEQNPEGATFGFGVVFSDQALSFLKASDPDTYDLITPHMETWQNMTINHPDDQVILDGVGFAAIGRLELIEVLKDRARALGVDIRFDTHIAAIDELQADLVIGADGLNSVLRQTMAERFAPKMDHFKTHFAWFGAEVPFDTLTQTFVQTENGPMNAHHYRFSKDRSTFIVECEEDTFRAFGFETMGEAKSARVCSNIFADVLKGTQLVTNKSNWRQFPRLWCENWVADRYVLLGDAAHTAHFSIGSGTRLALEDAIALVDALKTEDNVDQALQTYQTQRMPIAKKIVDAANTSAIWYDSFGEKMTQPPLEFAYGYLARSGRLSRDRMRGIAPEFVKRFEAEVEGKIVDPVPAGLPCAQQIGFEKSTHPNCSELLWQNLSRNPDKTALIGPFDEVSYAELVAKASQWGHAFGAMGLQRGARIAFFLDDTPVLPAAFFGAVRAGFVPVLLNIQTKPDLLSYFLKDSGARLALCDAEAAHLFEDSGLEKVVIAEEADAFLCGHATTLDVADTGPDDMAFWMYSSGSTGRPKGIVHLHHDMFYVQQSYGTFVLKLRGDDVCYSVPKGYFAYGFGNSFIFPFSIGATTLLLSGQPRPDVVLGAIETYRPSVLFGLPTLYTALARHESIETRDLSSLRQSMSAAEILSKDVYDAWADKVGHGPTEGLGSTEMLHIYLSNALGDHRLGAAGAVVPGYEVKLETTEGEPVAPGREGVMFVRGDSSSPTYWKRPDKTTETMRGDWIYTGDLFVEKNGYYYFHGRADELIKVSGQWVWPMEVERCLNEHKDVNECAVLAHQLDDKRMGLRAYVSLVRGSAPGDPMTSALRDFVKSELTPYKAPRQFEYIDTLPKTGTGKIDRQALIAAHPNT
ncbi:benzoate-CoA ligase family protein [Phaeobacter sp. C3_T13_0]|uniref:benzoate-CoA ligase family protein n=1 Tax=Phaeobacter cretensis TaxID=3342641 RepID=UPI0039BCCA4B